MKELLIQFIAEEPQQIIGVQGTELNEVSALVAAIQKEGDADDVINRQKKLDVELRQGLASEHGCVITMMGTKDALRFS